MELADVEAFLVLADELHFGRTAERMHVSTTRVSQRIRALERQVGAPLFDRTSRRVALTPLGAQLRTDLAPAYDNLFAAMDAAKSAARTTTGVLRVGFTATTGGEPLNKLIRSYEKRYPPARVSLHEVPMATSHHALRAGEVDVLVNWVVDGVDDLTFGPVIASFPRMLAVAIDHPLADRDRVSTDDFVDYLLPNVSPFELGIRAPFSPTTSCSGVPFRFSTTPAYTTNEIITQVARGLVVHPTASVLQPLAHREDIRYVAIDDLPPLDLGLIWVPSRENARIRALARLAVLPG